MKTRGTPPAHATSVERHWKEMASPLATGAASVLFSYDVPAPLLTSVTTPVTGSNVLPGLPTHAAEAAPATADDATSASAVRRINLRDLVMLIGTPLVRPGWRRATNWTFIRCAT